MKKTSWSIEDAKNGFSAVVAAARSGRPQTVTRHGKPAVVVVAVEEFARLQAAGKAGAPRFNDLLLAMPADDGAFERVADAAARRRALMFPLDTVVLSELRRRRRDPGVERWLSRADPATLYLSGITIGEIERGIELRRAAEPEFAELLADWLARVLLLYGERVLPVTISIARRWGRQSATLGHANADLLIAATALDHGLTVVTRDAPGFAPTGVAVLNPFRG